MTLPTDKTPWYVKGKWNISPLSWSREVRSTMPNLPKRVYIRDSTLREGEETTGCAFSMKDQIKIAQRLADIGVVETDVGYPIRNPFQMELLKALKKEGVDLGYYTIIPIMPIDVDWKKNIDVCVKAGGENLTIKLTALSAGPTGNVFTKEAWARALEAIEYCKKEHSRNTVAIGPMSSTLNLELFTYLRWCDDCVKAGVDEIEYIDSRGVGLPVTVKYVVSEIKKVIGEIPIGLHMHNDFGLAVANSLAGVEGGASWVQTTVNGLGDRAGNASFEEVVAALEIHYGVDTGIDMSKLYELSKFVEKVGRVKCQPHKAIVGDNAWLEESHAFIVLNSRKTGDWGTSEAYSPSLVGQEHKIAFGKTALRPEAIKMKLDEVGVKYTENDVLKIRESTEKEIEAKISRDERSYLTEDEFVEFAKKIIKS